MARREAGILDYGSAIAVVRGGGRVSLPDWDDPEFVCLFPGYPEGVRLDERMARAARLLPGTLCRVAPFLVKRDALGVFCAYTPSQDDQLREDWRHHDW